MRRSFAETASSRRDHSLPITSRRSPRAQCLADAASLLARRIGEREVVDSDQSTRGNRVAQGGPVTVDRVDDPNVSQIVSRRRPGSGGETHPHDVPSQARGQPNYRWHTERMRPVHGLGMDQRRAE